jgi:hypothetical protein
MTISTIFICWLEDIKQEIKKGKESSDERASNNASDIFEKLKFQGVKYTISKLLFIHFAKEPCNCITRNAIIIYIIPNLHDYFRNPAPQTN